MSLPIGNDHFAINLISSLPCFFHPVRCYLGISWSFEIEPNGLIETLAVINIFFVLCTCKTLRVNYNNTKK